MRLEVGVILEVSSRTVSPAPGMYAVQVVAQEIGTGEPHEIVFPCPSAEAQAAFLVALDGLRRRA